MSKKRKRNSEKNTTKAKGVVGCFKKLSVRKTFNIERITDEG